MKVYNNIPLKKNKGKSIISIGSFDGLHLGHQELLERNLEKSKNNYQSIVITFFPTPQAFFKKDAFYGYLTSKKEKIKEIEKKGVEILCCLEFNETLRKVSAEAFLEKIIKIFNPKLFVLGYDHSFGYKRRGDLEFLEENKKKYSYEVIKISEIQDESLGEVSSSVIRGLLLNSEVSKANSILGRNYKIKGKVVSGKGLGRKINFPTANIEISKDGKIIPSEGVYFVKVYLNKASFYGMCNVGFKPTVSKLEKKTIEVHLFNFDKNIYNVEISIEFLDFIRKEKKFKSISLLKNQLEKDRNKCLEYSINNC